MLCSFLVLLVAVERCHGSRSDVRQQLRSEVVYSERNHKEGRYKYGYAVKKGETQFHHQRSLDGAMYGCYGYVDPLGKLFITHYLADMAGYRLVNMANPDRKLAERIRNLGTAENPIDLQHLFPAECQEDGDIKTLQETANAMKASLAESGDQSTSYRSRSSYHSASAISQDSTVRDPVASVKANSEGIQFEPNQQFQDLKTLGSVNLVKTATSGVDQVKSNLLQTGQQSNLGFKATSGSIGKIDASQPGTTSESESSADLTESNVNRGSNLVKTTIRTLPVTEPKFVMKSNSKDSSVRFATSDSSKSSTLEKTGVNQKVLESGGAINVASGYQASVEKSKFLASDIVGSKGSSVVKQTTVKQQSGGAEEASKHINTEEFSGSLKTFGEFDESTQNIAFVSVIEKNKKTSEAFNISSNRGKITDTNQGHAIINTESDLTSNVDKSGTNNNQIIKEVKENSEKHINEDLKAAAYSKEPGTTKSIIKHDTNGAISATFEEPGSQASSSNAAGTMKTIQSDTYTGNNVVKTMQAGGINQIHGNYQPAVSMKSIEESQSKKIVEKQQSSNLKISKSDSATVNKINVATINDQVIKDQQVSLEALKDTFPGKLTEGQQAASLVRNGATVELLSEVDQVITTSAELAEKVNTAREDSVGVKTLDREFLSIGERQTDTFGQISSVKEIVEGIRSGVAGYKQDSGSSTTKSKVEDSKSIGEAEVTISSSEARAKDSSMSFVRQSEHKDLQETLDHGTAESMVLQENNLARKDSLTLDSALIKSKQKSSLNETVEIASTRIDESTLNAGRTKTPPQSETSTSRGKADSMTSSTAETGISKTVVGNLEQEVPKDIVDHGTEKSTVLENSRIVSKVGITSDSNTVSHRNENDQEQSVKVAAKISDVSNYEEINLRFDDEDSRQPSKVESYARASSSTKTNQDIYSGRSSLAVNRGTVKYADYATENKQLADHSNGITGEKILEAQRTNQRSKARVQQETLTSLEQNNGKNQQGGRVTSYQDAASSKSSANVSNSRKAAVTIPTYIKDSAMNDAPKQAYLKDAMQVESVKQSTDMSTKQEVKFSQKTNSELEYSTKKQNVKVAGEQKIAKDRMIDKESSDVTEFKQDSEIGQTGQKFVSEQEYDTNKPNVVVSADQNKAQVHESSGVTELKQDYNQSEVLQTQRFSETGSGRSFNQVKSDQSVQQVKEASKDSTPIIRFAIPGIIQQGPPVQGRRSFVGIPNNYLNNIFPTNFQSRVSTVTVSEEDNPRLEVQRLPATPRTTTPAQPDDTTVSYHLASGTDRNPVTPRPTTGLRPVTPGFLATTAKSLISRTTVSPSGDIYDEIDEELDLGSRPTLMSPQIPEQKPPNQVTSISSGGVTVIPSISQGVTVEQTGLPHCYEVTLQIPSDAKQIFVRTNSPAFRVFGDGDPNERIRLVESGVYEVNLGATSGIQFNQYQADDDTWKRSNKLQLDVDRSFDYSELVQKPLYSRTQSGHTSTTTGGGVNQARLNNPYLPLVPAAVAAAAPVEARNAGGSEEQVLTPEQRSLLSLVPSWKKVLLYY